MRKSTVEAEENKSRERRRERLRTLVVAVVGAALLGVMVVERAQNWLMNHDLRLLAMVGLLGLACTLYVAYTSVYEKKIAPVVYWSYYATVAFGVMSYFDGKQDGVRNLDSLGSESVYVSTKDGVVETDSNLIYVGKCSTALFLYDRSDSSSMVIPMDEVKRIKRVPHKAD